MVLAMDGRSLIVQLMRHGESAANAGQITTGPAEIPLTAAGVVQAEALSRSLVLSPAAIICSPFLRARQTAAPANRRFGVPVEIWPIQEFTYLAPVRCAGTTVAERRTWVEAYWRRCDPAHVDGPGAESFAQLVDRVRTTLDRLLSYRGSVLMIGHGHFMQALRWWIEEQPAVLTAEHVHAFRQRDLASPIPNSQGYVLMRTECGWEARPSRGTSYPATWAKDPNVEEFR